MITSLSFYIFFTKCNFRTINLITNIHIKLALYDFSLHGRFEEYLWIGVKKLLVLVFVKVPITIEDVSLFSVLVVKIKFIWPLWFITELRIH